MVSYRNSRDLVDPEGDGMLCDHAVLQRRGDRDHHVPTFLFPGQPAFDAEEGHVALLRSGEPFDGHFGGEGHVDALAQVEGVYVETVF